MRRFGTTQQQLSCSGDRGYRKLISVQWMDWSFHLASWPLSPHIARLVTGHWSSGQTINWPQLPIICLVIVITCPLPTPPYSSIPIPALASKTFVQKYIMQNPRIELCCCGWMMCDVTAHIWRFSDQLAEIWFRTGMEIQVEKNSHFSLPFCKFYPDTLSFINAAIQSSWLK